MRPAIVAACSHGLPVAVYYSGMRARTRTPTTSGSGWTSGSGRRGSSRRARWPRRRSAGGKVQVNGDRAKRARPLQVGDEVRVRLGPYEHTVVVRALSARRGPASVAAGLYEERPESLAAREAHGAAAQDAARRVRAGEGPADQAGPAGDRPAAGAGVSEGPRRCAALHMFSTIAFPNSLVLSSVAPGHQPLEVVGDPLLGDGLLQRA